MEQLGTSQLLLLWYGGTTIIDRAVKWVTKSVYSHSAIVVKGVLYEEQASGLLMDAGTSGQQRAEMATAYKVVPITVQQEQAIIAFLKETIEQGGKYNYAELVLAAFTRLTGVQIVVAKAGDYDCSAIVSECLTFADQVPPKECRDMYPGDVFTWQQPVADGSPPLSLLLQLIPSS